MFYHISKTSGSIHMVPTSNSQGEAIKGQQLLLITITLRSEYSQTWESPETALRREFKFMLSIWDVIPGSTSYRPGK